MFKKYLIKSSKKNSNKTMFLVDILYMKDINAIYNFDNGNYIIKQLHTLLKKKILRLIQKNLKRDVTIYVKNAYTDVFEILIYDDLDLQEIIKIKNLIYFRIIDHNFKTLNSGIEINIDVTIGCSKSEDENMIRIYAEKALHNAKVNYNHYIYYDSQLFNSEGISKDLLNIFQENIKNKSIEPFLQPIIDNVTGEVVKYEALMRIYDKEGNILLPGVFILKAKKSRMYNHLMEVLIEKVVEYIKKYKIHISINLDYTDIMNPNIKKSIISKVNKEKIGKYLTIEVLESEKISNFSIVNDFIDSVKKYDVTIAIDDFGSGFSNYENILNLNIDVIKIDGSLIKRINEEIYLSLVKSIVLFCKQQDIKTVAEFVSDLKIHRYVKAIEIDYSQGFYLGKPQHINEIIGEKDDKE